MFKRRNRKIALLLVGAALVVASLAIPLVAVLTTPAPGTGIIGGADAPTYWLLYTQLKMYIPTALGCAALIGGLACR